MNSLTTVGMLTTGHGTWPPVAAVSGDPFIKINGQPIVVEGSVYSTHCKPGSSPQCHAPTVLPGTGNPGIQINGVPAAYVGLALSCGDVIAEGVSV